MNVRDFFNDGDSNLFFFSPKTGAELGDEGLRSVDQHVLHITTRPPKGLGEPTAFLEFLETLDLEGVAGGQTDERIATVTIYKIDNESGDMTAVEDFSLPTPVCIRLNTLDLFSLAFEHQAVLERIAQMISSLRDLSGSLGIGLDVMGRNLENEDIGRRILHTEMQELISTHGIMKRFLSDFEAGVNARVEKFTTRYDTLFEGGKQGDQDQADF